MSNISDNTLHRLDALNKWLGDVYDEETDFSTLLIDAGFNKAEIEEIKQKHLSEFLQAIIDLLDSDDLSIAKRNTVAVVRHYGLIDGNPENFYAIGSSVGVCGERIKQLTHQGLGLYREPKQQTNLRDGFATIGRRLLDDSYHS